MFGFSSRMVNVKISGLRRSSTCLNGISLNKHLNLIVQAQNACTILYYRSMTRYIIRRLLQAIPLLFIISLIMFILMQNMGDPVATMGGRKVTRSEDRNRLARQLGLDKPVMSSISTG